MIRSVHTHRSKGEKYIENNRQTEGKRHRQRKSCDTQAHKMKEKTDNQCKGSNGDLIANQSLLSLTMENHKHPLTPIVKFQ